MKKRTALVAGATGLVGKEVVKELCRREEYSEIIAITRSELKLEHPKLTNKVIDFNYLEGVHIGLADDIYCCLGTTIKKAKSKEAFRMVDLDYPLQLAVLAKKNNAQQFLVISAMGASPSSRFFYNKIKGLMEEQLKGLGLTRLQIFRPSLLIGDREEFRFGETLGAKVMSFAGWMLVGPLKSYKAIRAEQVALAMVEKALTPPVQKVEIHKSGAIEQVERTKTEAME
ncbi:NAD(P)H-binding protein [Jeotgalibacillus proteolyticus]|uniref:Oxidoreductase n=1 Tax=Jeotgalibacillus proteolyticus TaxID=2082395 RepID=A0A2S5G9S0_9BACL|nr:NAD(P)H-binding protein [Jeotgalibacillus proteolyticus]PPA69738.1 oxidoreductase [Jeotgalibacillus proteolyticus]